MMLKVLKGMAPNYLKCCTSLPQRKTDFLKKSFANRGVASWNKLPSDMIREVVECPAMTSLLRILKDYINLLQTYVFVYILHK